MSTTEQEIKQLWVDIERTLDDPNATEKDVKAARKMSFHVKRLEHAARMTRMMLSMEG